MEIELDEMNAVMPSSQQRELENYKFVFDQHAVISVTDAEVHYRRRLRRDALVVAVL
ncbi:MAG: hypothetical protein Q7J20_05050 [Candidatus Nitrotoga sp.]|nr:hypothetical protein [Candidatus Nitrotoga sp.]MDO9447255.1 hypothetical protein [Candidatus Nitrotoga sp.]MDP1637497.1 hypothetical protein [Candidatus Nitrotoga sp.]MDP3497473.1 hypothetical protein [Candidatus Nitrotoga sp.]